MIVHLMMYGLVACGKHTEGAPNKWGPDHRWSSYAKDVTCPECRAGMALVETFTIGPDGKSITCQRCKSTSYHPKDVDQHYCGRCKVSHDNIWPHVRLWWMSHPPGNTTPTKDTTRWITKGLPDAHTDVLLRCSDPEYPVWVGFHDGEVWRNSYVETIEVPVLGWLHLKDAARTLDGKE